MFIDQWIVDIGTMHCAYSSAAHCYIQLCGSCPFHEAGPRWLSHTIAYWAMTRIFLLCLNCNTWIFTGVSNINHGNANPHVSFTSAGLRCICEAVPFPSIACSSHEAFNSSTFSLEPVRSALSISFFHMHLMSISLSLETKDLHLQQRVMYHELLHIEFV
ncbi:hypothetical protein CY34DRAFT_140519 [Suillus luteus UH-Slu-Lm8-n1]|uniref:Uncharacterized protein n=1 Tax=Suillus luteus UH-Slu-Lm8-n1 TaxID=930992 RepID=A0A0C9ZTE8_9AGAM|nr:hypothetical protein CY34DRAFT_140519 [Suillus luteus UH-Slu-Lm8-n1]